jgi:hypothetical protein
MNSDADPRSEYLRRLEQRKKKVARYEREDHHISVLRLITAIAFVLAAVGSFVQHAISGWWLLLPVGQFTALVIVHERVARAVRRARKSVTFYEDGLARIDDRWIGRGQSTELFRDENHLYARDLDIFGEASLFELLCTARMRSGEVTLASWLAEAAPRDEIIARQAAVAELRNRIDLREELAILASDLRSSIHPEILTQWGTAPRMLDNKPARVLMAILAVITVAALVEESPYRPAILAVDAAVGLFYRRRVRDVMGVVERPEHELELLSQILGRIEKESFQAAKLVQLRQSLDTDGQPPSRQIGRFARLLNTLDWRRNQLFAPVSVLVFWATQFTFAIEAWRARCGPSIGPWMNTVGEFEALCALAGYAYEHPSDPFPEIAATGRVFEGAELKHPLMAASRCVANSVHLDQTKQLLVVSGSNMSGKSTLLRTAGINAVLALAGAPVRAESLRLSPLAIGATLRIQDSLQAGTSRFYAEIQRIHHIMELTKGELPVFFLLDEVLHGTNSHDRAVGAEAIVRGLLERGAIGLVTTHDLALAKVADALGSHAENVHFEDDMAEGRMVFDYRMRPGIVQKSNALALMRAVGLEV